MRLLIVIASGVVICVDAVRRLAGYGYPENQWIGWLQLAAVALVGIALVATYALTRDRWSR